jgi:fructosamine-3-kinase
VSPSLLHGGAQRTPSSPRRRRGAIDPAVHFGNPEVDRTHHYFKHFPADVFDGYRDVRPIDPGFGERRSLWRIFAYLAVVTVAGARYLPELVSALDEYVS